MIAKLLVAPLFVAASVMAVPASLSRRDVSLSDWSSQGLESYYRFKVRYASLNCASQQGSSFYDECCGPLGANDSLSSRPDYCTPSAYTCSAPSVSEQGNQNSVDYDDEDDYDESNLPWCEEGEDEYGNTTDGYTPTDNTTDNGNTDTGSTDTGSTDTGNTDTGSTDNTNNNSGGSSGDVQLGGFATYYYQNGNAGACGEYHGDSELIAAIDISRYGWTGQASSECGRGVRITNLNNGQSVDVIIRDVCPTCTNGNSIDLSEGAFAALAPLGDGMVPISWYYTS